MSTSKIIDRICIFFLVVGLVLTTVFMNGKAMGISTTSQTIGYEDLIFDTSRVHSIDIVMDNWEDFIENCEDEEYRDCTVVIDGESLKNVAIRAKGNTSLSQVRSLDSERYSFKLEFDQYNDALTYHGLDKLCLNNIIQDKTYMKDYLTYRMMAEFGVTSPLCSYAWITVNGEPWGLYLAVEAVEDSFLNRNYGRETGNLYKPDSMSMGGGRGNGREFNLTDFLKQLTENEDEETQSSDAADGSAEEGTDEGSEERAGGFPGGFDMGDFNPEDFNPEDFNSGDFNPGEFNPGDFSFGDMPSPPDFFGEGEASDGENKGGFGGFGGNTDVKLQYSDDDVDSYSNIFNNAKTNPDPGDKKRLIASIKQMNEQTDLEEVVDIDEVIRYFVVHNFVVNSDSYTGAMVHNYYLHEADGVMQMIPWDYNLAFGSFQAGGDATSSVNDPIDTPVSSFGFGKGGPGGMPGASEEDGENTTDTTADDQSDRPMWAWIAENEEYLAQYHELFSEFLAQVNVEGIIEETYALIAPYVAEDPTAFCTAEEFETAVSAFKEWCALRIQSVEGQLSGEIPSTTSGQAADDSALIDASGVSTSDMGGMGGGMGGPGGDGDDKSFGKRPDFGGGEESGRKPGSGERPEKNAKKGK